MCLDQWQFSTIFYLRSQLACLLGSRYSILRMTFTYYKAIRKVKELQRMPNEKQLEKEGMFSLKKIFKIKRTDVFKNLNHSHVENNKIKQNQVKTGNQTRT
jgi:hypothetical protein